MLQLMSGYRYGLCLKHEANISEMRSSLYLKHYREVSFFLYIYIYIYIYIYVKLTTCEYVAIIRFLKMRTLRLEYIIFGQCQMY